MRRLGAVAGLSLLLALGCGRSPATEADPGAATPSARLAALARGLASPDAVERMAAAKRAGALGADAATLLGQLEQIAKADADADTRRIAARVVRNLRAADHDDDDGGARPAPPVPEPAPPPAQEPPKHSILGTWNGSATAKGTTVAMVFDFRRDGTFLLEFASAGGAQQALNGTYTYQGGVVTTTPGTGGEVERATIDWIDQDSFTYFGGGFKIRYQRAR